jgi:hypothetical protein
MGLFRRSPKRSAPRGADPAVLGYLEQWARSRQGVEAYLEPKTHVTELTLLLVAHDGEWTRRRIGTPESAYGFTQRLGMPFYDAVRVGYPQRMRDWNSRNKAG